MTIKRKRSGDPKVFRILGEAKEKARAALSCWKAASCCSTTDLMAPRSGSADIAPDARSNVQRLRNMAVVTEFPVFIIRKSECRNGLSSEKKRGTVPTKGRDYSSFSRFPKRRSRAATNSASSASCQFLVFSSSAVARSATASIIRRSPLVKLD